MTQTKPTILWDFDGTLASRPGGWRSALMEVLDKHEPEHDIDGEQIRQYLRSGFPWHQPEQPHHHLSTPGKWWSHIEVIFARAFRGVGFDIPRAGELVQLVRERYIAPEKWVLYEDTIPALEHLSQRGWNHAILSNHVPELPDIIRGLSLFPHISCCITSASTGYEKPNPEAFKIALVMTGNPERVWMIGDEPVADIQGAEAVGLPAILVRSPQTEGVRHYAPNLLEAVEIINTHSNVG